MPFAPKKPCRAPGCPALTSDRYCEQHRASEPAAATQAYDRYRGSAHSRGYDAAWVRVRNQKLKQTNHLCEPCLAEGRPTPATEVHHSIPIAVDPSKRLDISLLVSVCHTHHMRLEADMRKQAK